MVFKQERYSGFDWLRVVAAIGIVGCHLALPNMTSGALWIKQFTDLNVGFSYKNNDLVC